MVHMLSTISMFAAVGILVIVITSIAVSIGMRGATGMIVISVDHLLIEVTIDVMILGSVDVVMMDHMNVVVMDRHIIMVRVINSIGKNAATEIVHH